MQGQAWFTLLNNWLPFILIVVFWMYFMKRGAGGKQVQYMERNLLLMDQQQKLLERIAAALEDRTGGPR